MPPPGKEAIRGGPKGLSTLQRSSEAIERAFFLRCERNLDIVMDMMTGRSFGRTEDRRRAVVNSCGWLSIVRETQ